MVGELLRSQAVPVVRRNPDHAELVEDGDDGEGVALTDRRGPLFSVKQCPYCARDMERDAMVCQHCGRDWKTGVSQNEDRELDKSSTSGNISTSRPRRPSGQMVAAAYLAVVGSIFCGRVRLVQRDAAPVFSFRFSFT